MCNWVTMLYSRKLREHCKPAVMKKVKKHYKPLKKTQKTITKSITSCCIQLFWPIDLFFFFLSGRTCSIWKFPGQGSNLSHRCNLYHSCSDDGSLTHCTELGIEPNNRSCCSWTLNPLCHSGNSCINPYMVPLIRPRTEEEMKPIVLNAFLLNLPGRFSLSFTLLLHPLEKWHVKSLDSFLPEHIRSRGSIAIHLKTHNVCPQSSHAKNSAWTKMMAVWLLHYTCTLTLLN